MALTSVWEGGDAAFLETALRFYSAIDPEPILDATYNAGRFWRGSRRRVVGVDIMPGFGMCRADNRRLPFRAGVFGCVVYDPPHVGPQGRDKSVKGFEKMYGAHVACGAEHDWNLSYLYPPFLAEARRVMAAEAVLFAKITDMVNNHRSKWPHADFMRMAEEAGFVVCDLVVKVRRGPMRSSKWRNAHHARKRHCFWLVLRNSTSCER